MGLTATAVKVIREQVAARAARKDALAAEKRTAGTTDPSKLTAELLREELKLRRERGETIDVPLRSNKPVLLAALVRARAAAPDVPRPAAATGTAAAAAGGGGEALIAPTDGVEKLVGQRVEAVWEDKDGSTDWFPATIVAHWPTNSLACTRVSSRTLPGFLSVFPARFPTTPSSFLGKPRGNSVEFVILGGL